jgi:hypothetical protein
MTALLGQGCIVDNQPGMLPTKTSSHKSWQSPAALQNYQVRPYSMM